MTTRKGEPRSASRCPSFHAAQCARRPRPRERGGWNAWRTSGRACDRRRRPANTNGSCAGRRPPRGEVSDCQRAPASATNACRCHGGNGFIMENAMARHIPRGALNSIWERHLEHDVHGRSAGHATGCTLPGCLHRRVADEQGPQPGSTTGHGRSRRSIACPVPDDGHARALVTRMAHACKLRDVQACEAMPADLFVRSRLGMTECTYSVRFHPRKPCRTRGACLRHPALGGAAVRGEANYASNRKFAPSKISGLLGGRGWAAPGRSSRRVTGWWRSYGMTI